MTLRVVLDTNILLSALAEKGVKHLFLRLGRYRRRWRVESFFRIDPRGCGSGDLATRQLRSIRHGPNLTVW